MVAPSSLLLGLASSVLAANPTATGAADVAAAQATAKTSSPTSNVPGLAFDRFVIIWLENTDYDKAVGDPNLAALAKKGLTLSNSFAVTHPSEPNYVASVTGDYFGIDNDNFAALDKNVSTIVDLLDTKGISWGEYQEDMPYSGFQGFAWTNQKTGANDYVRKHNPLVMANSTAVSEQRLSQQKNLTMFYKDLEDNKLPQWMFITPNMTSDGHDTSVTTAGAWTSNFLTPLLNNTKFMNNTLVLVTWDENHTYSIQNRVASILLGDALPKELVGQKDSNYYNHYSSIATVEANWCLPTLGRNDVGANVYKFVGDRSGDKIRDFPEVTGSGHSYYFNSSYMGPFNSANGKKQSWPYATPNIHIKSDSGREVLPAIQEAFAKQTYPATYYNSSIKTHDGAHPPAGFAAV